MNLALSDDYVLQAFFGALTVIGTALVILMGKLIGEIRLMRKNMETLKDALNLINMRMNMCKQCPKISAETLVTLSIGG